MQCDGDTHYNECCSFLLFICAFCFQLYFSPTFLLKTVLLLCDQAGFSALHLSAQNGHNESARILLFAGCSPDHRNGVRSSSHVFVLVLLEYYCIVLIAFIVHCICGPGGTIVQVSVFVSRQ